ncbi:MAG: iron-sulfur cluster assembly scaffold protein [Caldilineaceae bacterium]|nr:iron-sulfur cluster assembly scaffold protein [Caldilineaceae bacterium]MCB9138077.1 iron-sulfur cluster assembly scaffold protein [Caldilineaceae bacterium]
MNPVILEHYKHPRRHGALAAPTVRRRDVNPFCGDEVTIDLLLANGRIEDAGFDGRGCSLSLAAASILLDNVTGRPIDAVRRMSSDDMLALLDMEIGPIRRKCALLPFSVLQACLAEEKNGHE